MRKLLMLLLLVSVIDVTGQGIKSPDEFLGYPLGSKYTPHHDVVAYFNSIASASARVKLDTYGKTNEGRQLLYALISSEENIKNIEAIRKNYMSMSATDAGKVSGNPNMPVVVWLSYNVHGNEASSTEVSMKVLFDLASRNDNQMMSWLKNTVIIIDPCLNPDGRDRYVNWYQQMQGVSPNPLLSAREHEEPWPGGRVNHYYFDLNRDWAWQTQVESKNRAAVYHQWKPAIHCDFHEQGIDAPYYFAPAAEPFHQVITPWQRSFQQAIGKNHASYFDKNGWLYFTREIFDLFYPSYGDTYPTYNGSIGMTYEQAGHSASGIEVNVGKQLLTLKDRIAHHYTTSMSTIEVASANATKINQEYQRYFSNLLQNGSGQYKSFIIVGSGSENIETLKKMLSKNKISYQFTKPGIKIKGYHYFSGKEESYTTKEEDIVVTTCQSGGALARVLLEPKSELSDSLTYDITAWSLPYAFGLDAWAVNENIATVKVVNTSSVKLADTSSYAILVEYRSTSAGVLLSKFLRLGVTVKVSSKDFVYNGHSFNKGTLIILRHFNQGHMGEVTEVLRRAELPTYPVSSGYMDSGSDFGSDKIHTLDQPAVALLCGNETSANPLGEVWHFFDKELEYPITLINAESISTAALKDIDVLIATDGQCKLLSEKESALKSWVRDGGRLIAMEGSVNQLAAGEWGIKMKKEPDSAVAETTTANLTRYENRERNAISKNTPGAIYKVILDNSHPLAFGYPEFFYLLKMNSNLLELNKDVCNVAILNDGNTIAGFVGADAKTKIKNGTVMSVQDFGNGTLVCITDDIIFRDFWENGKLLLINSVFMYMH